jgi:hypothetical protein
MSMYFKLMVLFTLAINTIALAISDAPPMPELAGAGSWPLAGYGLAFVLVGGAVYVSLFTSKRTNID